MVDGPPTEGGATTPPPVRDGGAVWRGVAVVASCILPSFLGGAVVDDLRRSFAFDDTAVGVVFSVYWGLAALVAVPGARLAGRLGPVRALRLAGLTSALVCVLVAVFATSALSFGVLLLGGGLAAALATPAVNVLIMHGVDRRRRGFAFAVATSSPPLGLLFAGTLVPVLGGWLDWRMLYGVAALLAATAAVSVRHAPAGAPAIVRPPRAAAGSVRPLAIVMVGVTAANASLGVITAFLVSSAPDAGVSGRAAAVVLAVGAAVTIVTRLAMGVVVDRRGSDPLPVAVVLLVVGAVGFALMAIQLPVPFVLGAFLVLGPGWVWLSMFSLGVVSRYAHSVEAASGVVQTGFFAGGVIGPMAFGLISDLGSYRLGWIVVSCAGLVAATSVALGRATLPRHGEHAARVVADDAPAAAP